MKKLFTLFGITLCILLLSNSNSFGQIAVTVTNPTNTTPNLASSYVSLANALTALNSVTAMTGPVVLTLTPGGSETTPPTGLTIGSATLNSVLSATNTITIIVSGGTATLNAGVGTSTPGSAVPDGILKIIGADYITIDGLTFTDGNATNPATMEFGVGLFKLNLSDGARYNTIKNCTFNMQRINNASGSAPMVDGSVGILVVNSIPTAATTALVPTTAAGSNSYNKFYTNTLNGGNYGIALSGYAATTPFTAGDFGNDIGGSSAGTGNIILNFGGGAVTNPAAGIRANNQWGLNISYNTINNNNGAGVNHATTLRGIYAQAGTSANITISYNNVTVKCGATTSSVYAIDNGIGSTTAANTVNITNNTITGTYTTATTGAFYGIQNTASSTTVNINNNTISNISTPGTGALYGITAGSPTTLNVSNNNITGIAKTGIGVIYTISVGTAIVTAQNNTIDGINNTATANTAIIYGIYSGSSSATETYNNNIIRNISSTGTAVIYCIRFYSTTGNKTIQGNQIYSITSSGGGTIYPVYMAYGSIDDISGNSIYNLNITGATSGSVYGIYVSAGTTNNIYNNQIYGFGNAGGTAGVLYGLYISSGTTNNIYKNNIYNFSTASTGPTVYGLYISGGTTNNIYNNIINDLKTTAANSAIPLAGIYLGGGTTDNVYYNSVYLNAASTGALFGSTAVYASTTPTVDMRDNILVNVSTPVGATGYTTAYRRSTTTLTTYSANSNNNCYYAGTPSANYLIFYDGTNSDQTIGAFKTRVASRDASSFTENPPFLNVSSAPYNLHLNTGIPTQCESGGVTVSSPIAITTDYDGETRNASTPDVGADEFAGIGIDLSPPSITYTALTNTISTGVRALVATITDASGVPSSAPGWPVLYWKINSGSYTSSTPSSVVGNQFTYNFGAGVTSGDIVSYYIVAQDNVSPTPNVGANSSAGASGFSVNPPACSTPPTTPSSYLIVPVISLPYNQDFEGTVSNWSSAVTTGTNEWAIGTPSGKTQITTVHSGTKAYVTKLAGATATGEDEYILTPIFDFSTTTSPVFSFWHNFYTEAGYDACEVQFTTDMGLTWTKLDANLGTGGTFNTTLSSYWYNSSSASGSMLPPKFSGTSTVYTGHTSGWINSVSDLTALAGKSTVQFKFRYSADVSTSYDGWAIDDFSVFNLSVINPTAFTATPVSSSQINLGWTPNANGNAVLLIWGSTSTLGTPVNGTSYNVGDPIPGGGTVLQNDNNTSYSHTPLSSNTAYFYKAFSRDSKTNYSSGTTASATTPCGSASLPYSESFETISTANTLPTCMTATNLGSKVYTYLAATGSYNQAPHGTGTKFASFKYGCDDWIYTIPVNLTAGSTYNFSAYYVTDGLTGWTTLEAKYGTSPNAASMTNAVTGATVSSPINTTYSQLAGTITPASTGIYYIGIHCVGTSNPWYLTVDDISLVLPAPMSYSSSTTTQTVTSSLAPNSTNNQIIGVQVVVTGALSPFSITSFDFSTNGTDNPLMDLTNARVFYTGNSSTFAATGQFGSDYANPNGPFNISGSQLLSSGTNYFWLVYDISPGAGIGDFIDGECNQITGGIPMGMQNPTVQAPAGNRQIAGPLSGIYTVGISNFNKVTGHNLYTETITKPVSELKNTDKKKTGQNVSRKIQNTGLNNSDINDAVNTETYSVLMENGKPYTGSLFFSTKENTANQDSKGKINPVKKDNANVKLRNTDSPDAGVYATITAAVSDLNARGVNGPVTLVLTDATYSSETLPIVINQISGTSSGNTVTIKPSVGISPSITGSSASAILKLNGADYVIIDGSNSGTSTRDMTFSNTNTSTSTCVLWIGSASASDGASNDIIKNCNIVGNASTTTAVGICIGSGTTLGSIGEAANNNISVLNNNINTVQNAIYHNGIATGDQNYSIEDNMFGSSLAANQLGYRGAIFQNLQNFTIDENTVQRVSTSGTGTATGIWVTAASSNGTISRNVIKNVKNTNTGGYGANGIYLSSTNTASNIKVINNLVSNIAAYGYADVSSMDNGYGIMLETGGGYSVYNNTVSMNTDQTLTTGIPAAINIYSGITTANSVNIVNNIFVNLQTTGTYCYGIYCGAATTVLNYVDYNAYYITNATSGRLGYVGATTVNTLVALRIASGRDAYSITGNPGLYSGTNLQPDATDPNSWNINGKGIALTSVTTDINGTPRSTVIQNGATDIGAYEFTPSVNPNDAAYTLSTIVDAGTSTFTVAGNVVAAITWHSGTGTLPTALSVKYRSGENPPNPVIGGLYSNLNMVITPTGGSGFTYDMVYYYTPAILGLISAEGNIRLAKYDVSTGWVQWDVAPNTTNKTVSVAGLDGFSTFAFGDNTSPMPVQMKSFTSNISGRDVTLSWITEKELNNKGFEILRSKHGESSYSSISFINSKGNSNSEANYVYNDKKLNSGKYDYKLKQVDLNGHYSYFELSNFVEVSLPVKYNLSQNYPNPFNPSTKIDFELPFDSRVSIVVYDMLGREVKNLLSGEMKQAGFYTIDLNASNLSSGTYFYRMIANAQGKDNIFTKKMMIVK